jgi:hypothetical protein
VDDEQLEQRTLLRSFFVKILGLVCALALLFWLVQMGGWEVRSETEWVKCNERVILRAKRV